MKILHIFFAISVLIFLTYETLRSSGVALPEWTTSYLNDFLCMPIVLVLCLQAVHLIKKDSTIILRLPLILTLASFYAIYFELILPEVSVRYTADFIDVILYFSGALLFYFLQQLSFRKSSGKKKAA